MIILSYKRMFGYNPYVVNTLSGDIFIDQHHNLNEYKFIYRAKMLGWFYNELIYKIKQPELKIKFTYVNTAYEMHVNVPGNSYTFTRINTGEQKTSSVLFNMIEFDLDF